MTDRVEVDRADLEAVCNWWRGVGYAECDAAIKRIRELLEPPRCEARWVSIEHATSYRCWLQEGHDGEHQLDPKLWAEL